MKADVGVLCHGVPQTLSRPLSARREAQSRFSHTASEGACSHPTSSFWPPEPSDARCLLFRPPRVWYCVTAALVNKCAEASQISFFYSLKIASTGVKGPWETAGSSCFLSCRESGQLQWVEVDSLWPASGDSTPVLRMYLTVQPHLHSGQGCPSQGMCVPSLATHWASLLQTLSGIS